MIPIWLFATRPIEELARLTGQLREIIFSHGTVLFHEGDLGDRFYIVIEGELAPVAVSAIKLKPGEKPERALKRLPDEVGQVVRVHHGNGLCMDLRSGIVTRTEPGIGARRSFLLALLPIGEDEEE